MSVLTIDKSKKFPLFILISPDKTAYDNFLLPRNIIFLIVGFSMNSNIKFNIPLIGSFVLSS